MSAADYEPPWDDDTTIYVPVVQDGQEKAPFPFLSTEEWADE